LTLASAIDVALASPGWNRMCPAARQLARDAAELALTRGLAEARLAPPEPIEVSITLADDAEQRRLNRDYRGQDKATNVLAFPIWQPGMRSPPQVPLLLGDVVLAYESVAREAAEQGKPLADHLRHLIVHGVLHLLGHDHQTPSEAARMESLETAILAGLGVPDPYRDPMSSVDSEFVCP
jgi:probable rRNA maturation factor